MYVCINHLKGKQVWLVGRIKHDQSQALSLLSWPYLYFLQAKSIFFSKSNSFSAREIQKTEMSDCDTQCVTLESSDIANGNNVACVMDRVQTNRVSEWYMFTLLIQPLSKALSLNGTIYLDRFLFLFYFYFFPRQQTDIESFTQSILIHSETKHHTILLRN